MVSHYVNPSAPDARATCTTAHLPWAAGLAGGNGKDSGYGDPARRFGTRRYMALRANPTFRYGADVLDERMGNVVSNRPLPAPGVETTLLHWKWRGLWGR